MIKIVLLMLLFGACGVLGINFGNVFNDKYLFYKELLDFCKSLKTDISFLKTDIISIIEKNNYKSKLSDILVDVKNLMQKNTILQKNDILSVLEKYHFLTDQDKNCLVSIFCEIGTFGYEEELSKIEYNITTVDGILNDFKQNKLKFAGLSKKMGFLVGLLVCIALI